MGLVDDLRRLFADAEVSLVGARDERIEAERALAADDFYRARAAARRILDRAPHSPIGLALLADACEGAGLDAELEETLAVLSRVAGSSPDVWLRLGRVRTRVGASSREIRDALVRTVAWTDDFDPEKRWSARQARLLLADLEIAEGNAVRAEGWLAPLATDSEQGGDVRRRRLAAAVARRSTADVARFLVGFEPAVEDAEGQRLVGESHRLLGNASAAVRALARAAILEDPRAASSLREAVACASGLEESAIRAAETVADALNVKDTPLWRAALSAARGEASVAAPALREAIDSGFTLEGPGERAAARALSVSARDVALLAKVGELSDVDRLIVASLVPRADPAEIDRALDALLAPATERADEATESWLRAIARDLIARLASEGATAEWPLLLDRVGRHARALSDLDALRRLELLAAERARPVRLAIVGEFNAGKSTFVNALLGMDVAPTGILPTTAVPHVLRYGPDPIARARLRAGGARTVPPERLKSLLAEIPTTAISEVEVEVPFSYLQRVEIVDTPGFNAPDPAHAKSAMDALLEGPGVDLAVWLFDANQALKTSERRILEALVARGVPVQALLNKADRLAPADLERVLEVFREDARTIGLASWRPPLAFSAKSAVKARLAGDEAALTASGFIPVRALLEDEIAAHGDALKERGLRRRAHDVVVALRHSAERAHQARVARVTSRAQILGARLAHAALLDRAAALDAGATPGTQVTLARDDARADEIRRVVRDELRGALDAFRRERDELVAKDHPSMAPYLERRLVEHLETAGGRAIMSALAAETEKPPIDDIALDASAIARGFVAGGLEVVEGKKAARVRGDVEGPLLRALLGVVAARLRGSSQERPGRDSMEDAAQSTLPRMRELTAMAEVLAPPPVPGAQTK